MSRAEPGYLVEGTHKTIVEVQTSVSSKENMPMPQLMAAKDQGGGYIIKVGSREDAAIQW